MTFVVFVVLQGAHHICTAGLIGMMIQVVTLSGFSEQSFFSTPNAE